jgi:hypothetical protein
VEVVTRNFKWHRAQLQMTPLQAAEEYAANLAQAQRKRRFKGFASVSQFGGKFIIDPPAVRTRNEPMTGASCIFPNSDKPFRWWAFASQFENPAVVSQRFFAARPREGCHLKLRGACSLIDHPGPAKLLRT